MITYDTTRRRGRVTAAALAIMLVALGGCTFEEPDEEETAGQPTTDEATEETPDTSASPQDAAESSPAAAAAGSLTVAPPFPVDSLDPHGPTGLDLATRTAARALFDSPTVMGPDGPTPSLATSWEVADDTDWTLEIRGDATFHDGTALTAEDVRASLQRVIDLEGPLAGQFDTVTDVAAPGDTTLSITTSAPDGDLLASLSLLSVGPAGGIGDDGFWEAPVGSGPFAFDDFTAGESLTVSANLDHWDGAPGVDEMEFVWIPDEFGRATAIETGEVQVTWGLGDDQLTRLQSLSDVTVETVPTYASWVIWLNAQNEYLADARVRRALWHAVDWEQVQQDLAPETGALATSVVSPTVVGYAEQEPYPYDPDEARRLLEEAGYPDGFSMTTQFREQHRLITQAMLSYWSEIGVDVDPQEKEQAVWLEDLLALNWDVNVMTQSAATGDAGSLVGRLYPCEAERTGYCNEDLDAVLETVNTSVDPEVRNPAFAEAIAIIWEEAPGIYPMDVLEASVWSNAVEGFEPSPDSVPRFDDVTVAS